MSTYIMPRLQGMKVGTGSFFFVRMSNWLRPKHAAADLIECVRFAKDSPLEGDGFELTVSRRERNEPPSGSRHGGDKSPSPSGSLSSGYQWFESISLQRTVRLSQEVTRRGPEARLFARVCGAWEVVRSAETGIGGRCGAYRRQCLCRVKFQYRSASDLIQAGRSSCRRQCCVMA